MRAILRRRDVRLLFSGQFLSMFGDWAMYIALGVWARVLTGSNAEAGIVFLFLGLTGLVAEGAYVWEAAKRMGVRMPAECAGRGECDTCAVTVTRGGYPGHARYPVPDGRRLAPGAVPIGAGRTCRPRDRRCRYTRVRWC